jgi:hypothetical protein
VEGNEQVDGEAKAAAQGKQSAPHLLPPFLRNIHHLPAGISATKQAFKADLKHRWQERWKESPRYARLQKIDKKLPSPQFLTDIAGLSHRQSAILIQLRTRRIQLHAHLHKIKQVETPLCPLCFASDETVHHYLFECRAWRWARHLMKQEAGREASSLKYLLGTAKGMKTVLNYVGRTKRLNSTFGAFTPATH